MISSAKLKLDIYYFRKSFFTIS